MAIHGDYGKTAYIFCLLPVSWSRKNDKVAN